MKTNSYLLITHSHYSIHLKKDVPKRFTTVPIENKYNVYAIELYKDSVYFLLMV
jgi:hypothetical protein